MRDEIRRVALFGSGVAELTRHRAEQIVRDLVKGGDVRKGDFSAAVRELVQRSKENQKELARFMRTEIKNQIEGLGLASKREVERLERRVARLEESATAPAGKKTGAKKTTAKKATGKKATKTPARKTAAPRAAEGAARETPPTPVPGAVPPHEVIDHAPPLPGEG